MKTKNKIRTLHWLAVSLVFLTGCTVQLAPNYDASLYEGIIGTNVKTMELFAAVATGTETATFEKREPTYNQVIGALEALAIQSSARPLPEEPVSEKINEYLDAQGLGALTNDVIPSAEALNGAAKQIARMKEQDAKSGLSPLVVTTFKNAVVIYMDQVITYESFLDR